ncbi:MAG: hypothetical protein SOW25_05830 [Helicobacter sp.]|nr:hypothetical protein [Helicobacter sp.]
MNKDFIHYKEHFSQIARDFKPFLKEHLELKETRLFNKAMLKNEQYYKWQFLYALTNSGLFAKDYIGTEIHLPKGNKDSANIKIDAVIFDSKEWFLHYENYHKFKDLSPLAWLREHIICVIEFKKENAKNIE